jgi:hypothetical protein
MESYMKKQLYLLGVILILLIIGMPVIVLASDLTGAKYHGTIIISNNSTATTGVSVNMSLSSPALISQGWVDEDFNRVAIRDSTGSDVPFMPGYSSNPWMLWVPAIGDYSSLNYILYTGNTTLNSTKYYFPDANGMTIDNDISMRLYDNFTFEIENCYIDTTAGATKRIIFKQNACQLIVSATVSGTITFSISGGASVSATAIPSGEYDIEVTANTTDLMIYINDVLKGTAAFTDDVPYNSYDWVFFEGDTVKYVSSLKLYK